MLSIASILTVGLGIGPACDPAVLATVVVRLGVTAVTAAFPGAVRIVRLEPAGVLTRG